MRFARHAIVAAALLVACADSPDVDGPPDRALAGDDTFVPLPRAVDQATRETRQREMDSIGAPTAGRIGTGEDFYLAIHRSALGERWFLSGFMQQFTPAPIGEGAPYSVGTRVVSFQVQNGKLFVFDVDDRAQTSTVFDPQRVVEAYPIVTDPRIAGLAGAANYVVIDPAAGLNHFDAVSDYMGQWWSQRFTIELVFLQGYQRLADGISWEQVFAGYADIKRDWEDEDDDEESIDPNPFRTSGTLAVSLRRYREGSRYREVAPPATRHYYESMPRLVPDTGGRTQSVAHWDIYPGMRPIEWVISPTLAALDATPAYADVDLVGAVRTGIESWNEAFGFPVVTARVARPGESFSRDDVNYVIFDPDPTLTYAFASWRTNPNTGEIRGASVYFGSTWLDRSGFFAPTAATAAAPKPNPGPRITLQWGAVESQHLCAREAPGPDVIAAAMQELAPTAAYTPAESFERFIADLIGHEIGHTFSLRHNFKGSLLPPSSSLMDYCRTVDSVVTGGHPQSYDIAAVRWLYGLTPELPPQPYCTDADVGKDPLCAKYDRGADPLTVQWIPYYRSVRGWYLAGETDPRYLVSWVTGLTHFATQSEPAIADVALDALLDGVGVPVDPARAADPVYARGADLVLAWVLDKIAVVPTAPTAARIDEQVERVLRDDDGIRSPATRRALVDLLEKRQTLASYAILLRVRDDVAAELAAAPPGTPASLLARDLLARIDAATQPYFD